MFNTLLYSLSYVYLGFIVPVLIILGISFLCRNTDKHLDVAFGPQSEIYAGGIGIMIHELSHFILAIIFGHQITDCRLLIMPWNLDLSSPQTKLGYVNHRYNKASVYQSIGNAFIGTAPVYGCTAALYAVYKFLLPDVFDHIMEAGNYIIQHSVNLSLGHVWGILIRPFPLTITNVLLGILGICLIINITIGGFDLSNADLKSALVAGIELLIILFILIFVLASFGMDDYVHYYVIGFLTWFLMISSLSLFTAIIINLCSRILHFFIN